MINHLEKEGSVDKNTITGVKLGKYISGLLIVGFVVWLTIFKSGTTKAFEDVAREVQESIQDEDLTQRDSQSLKKYYGLNSAEYEGVLIYVSDFAMSAKEVLLIEVKHDTQVEEVKSAIEKRIETRKESFEGYAPEQVQLLEEAAYIVRGKYIFVAITPDAETYRQIFERSL